MAASLVPVWVLELCVVCPVVSERESCGRTIYTLVMNPVPTVYSFIVKTIIGLPLGANWLARVRATHGILGHWEVVLLALLKLLVLLRRQRPVAEWHQH